MNGIRALRIIAFMSVAIGIGILSRPAWGFIAFGILVLLDNFLVPARPVEPPVRTAADGDVIEP
jgi:hypothetical protein